MCVWEIQKEKILTCTFVVSLMRVLSKVEFSVWRLKFQIHLCLNPLILFFGAIGQATVHTLWVVCILSRSSLRLTEECDWEVENEAIWKLESLSSALLAMFMGCGWLYVKQVNVSWCLLGLHRINNNGSIWIGLDSSNLPDLPSQGCQWFGLITVMRMFCQLCRPVHRFHTWERNTGECTTHGALHGKNSTHSYVNTKSWCLSNKSQGAGKIHKVSSFMKSTFHTSWL